MIMIFCFACLKTIHTHCRTPDKKAIIPGPLSHSSRHCHNDLRGTAVFYEKPVTLLEGQAEVAWESVRWKDEAWTRLQWWGGSVICSLLS